jgi:phage shock protein A
MTGLQASNATLTAAASTHADDLTALQTQLTTVQSQLSASNAEVTGYKAQIAQLNADLTASKGEAARLIAAAGIKPTKIATKSGNEPDSDDGQPKLKGIARAIAGRQTQLSAGAKLAVNA